MTLSPVCFQVEATDADKGANAEVEYSLVTSPSSPESFFSIDRTTGQLTTLKVRSLAQAVTSRVNLTSRGKSLCFAGDAADRHSIETLLESLKCS